MALARDEERAALMPFMTGGFPTTAAAAAVAESYLDGGADLIELGVPYSDPLADGPVIHQAATEALAAGASFDSALKCVAEVVDRVPIVAMIYVNVIFAYGRERFVDRLAAAGVAGLIVPDLPLEQGPWLREALAPHGIALVGLIAPTTSPTRRTAICRASEGFVYAVSVTGVTGERVELAPGLADMIAAAKQVSSTPVAVGFGISSADQARAVAVHADGVIIGSRLVRLVAEAPPGDRTVALGPFLAEIRAALQRRR